eukprot:CAMPEP_0195287620 /NCGR_PEP_ID=MMETSP0707-20130614/4604_1 /TAXON_ID=33640 /ORGANISM="Asterionellopsis glacialis, Strain CCMP134" /LENGTH=56 /DNA_ID=CAMNT_0040347389 /DNA_START=387 /DNA_END=554 /DNA_ORIENTATION=-
MHQSSTGSASSHSGSDNPYGNNNRPIRRMSRGDDQPSRTTNRNSGTNTGPVRSNSS